MHVRHGFCATKVGSPRTAHQVLFSLCDANHGKFRAEAVHHVRIVQLTQLHLHVERLLLELVDRHDILMCDRREVHDGHPPGAVDAAQVLGQVGEPPSRAVAQRRENCFDRHVPTLAQTSNVVDKAKKRHSRRQGPLLVRRLLALAQEQLSDWPDFDQKTQHGRRAQDHDLTDNHGELEQLGRRGSLIRIHDSREPVVHFGRSNLRQHLQARELCDALDVV
mmetsp:Transcript_151703/g.486763  ORF Transcript_151703/g.486763 Transcript_151703/m.486763 type:complete len:221 (+) Transcript_151703:379-1041(+)